MVNHFMQQSMVEMNHAGVEVEKKTKNCHGTETKYFIKKK